MLHIQCGMTKFCKYWQQNIADFFPAYRELMSMKIRLATVSKELHAVLVLGVFSVYIYIYACDILYNICKHNYRL